jgi:hypothetical protein
VVAVCALALLGAGLRAASVLALSAGLFYGAADAAIKAIAVNYGSAGSGALLSGWMAVALLATFAGFLAFQAALRTGSGVSVISLMTALATLVALVCGLVAFGESLGSRPAVIAWHLFAIGLVLACVPVLAAAHTELAEEGGVATEIGPPRKVEASGERASHREQHTFDPRAGAGVPAP